MAIVFYYILKENIDKIKEGIKISEHGDKKLLINNREIPCILGLLCPKDDELKYQSTDYICLELDVDSKTCFVLNADLKILKEQDEYFKSIIPLEKYKFGLYRKPEVAIIRDINPTNIKVSGNSIGTPIIIENSHSIYKYNVFEEFRQKYGDFEETLLAVFFMLMAHKGKFKLLGKKLQDNGKTLYVYKDNETNKIYTISIQEGNKNE